MIKSSPTKSSKILFIALSALLVTYLFSSNTRAEETANKTQEQHRHKALKGSLGLYALPRFFLKDNFGKSDKFSKPGLPEFNFHIGLYRFHYETEPFIRLSFLYNVSDRRTISASSNSKSTYQLYGFSLGVRQYFWHMDFFPLIPFVETSAIYNVMIFQAKTTTSGTSTKANYRGGELGIDVGGGIDLSLAALNPSLRNELDSDWNLRDYGLHFQGNYYPSGIFRSGSFGHLGSIKSWKLGGGLYFGW